MVTCFHPSARSRRRRPPARAGVNLAPPRSSLRPSQVSAQASILGGISGAARAPRRFFQLEGLPSRRGIERAGAASALRQGRARTAHPILGRLFPWSPPPSDERAQVDCARWTAAGPLYFLSSSASGARRPLMNFGLAGWPTAAPVVMLASRVTGYSLCIDAVRVAGQWAAQAAQFADGILRFAASYWRHGGFTRRRKIFAATHRARHLLKHVVYYKSQSITP